MPVLETAYEIDPDGTVRIAAESFAAAVVEKLGASVIPSSFPAYVGKQIRQAAAHGGCMWVHTIPMGGAMCLLAEYRLNPDGTLNLEFKDSNGCIFWRGTFRPAEEASSAHA
jgi:hypothetical protein